jgi:hypothetical protein
VVQGGSLSPHPWFLGQRISAATDAWDDLSDDGKEARRHRAEAMVSDLKAIGYELGLPTDWLKPRITLSEEEIERNAETEHHRQVDDLKARG